MINKRYTPTHSKKDEPDFFGDDNSFSDHETIRHEYRRNTGERPRRHGLLGVVGSLFVWSSLLVIVAILAFTFIYGRYAYTRLYESEPSVGQIAILTIEQGDNFAAISRKLEMCGILRGFVGLPDRWLFKLYAMNEGTSHQIKTGAYQLNCNQSLSAIYSKLLQGSKDFKITIPEGKTLEETAAIISANIPTFDTKTFYDLAHSSTTIEQLGFDPKQLSSLEGYLYPSTYYYGPGMPEIELLKMMTNSFKKKMEAIFKVTQTEQDKQFTFQQHLILASLIEKEARSNEDRPLIASVLYNRLAKKMPLQIDATLQYAKGDFSTPPRPEDKTIDSPFNTYLNKGLPPQPICSPRFESMMATYNTPKSDNLYYVYKGNGQHAFATTYDQHRENITKYLKSKNSGSTESKDGSGAKNAAPAAPLVLPDDGIEE